MPRPDVRAEQAALADADALRAAAGQGAHDRGAAADVGAVAHDHALAEIRPSTIDVPRVPALKLTKPSCITVVPAARCAPSRTRSASAIRTPGGHDVVDHPRELVDAEHLDRPAGRRSRRRVSSKPSTAQGPWVVQTTLASTPKMPSRLSVFGADQPVREQVQAQVGVGRRRRGRRRGRSRWTRPRGARCGPRPCRRARPARRGRRPSAAGGPSAGSGYQVSRTTPSSVMVASPNAEAVRSLMGASLGEADDRSENGWWIGWRA